MNLGGIEAIAQQIAGAAMLDHAQETERKLDAKIEKLEQMDEDDFEKLREKRRLALMKQHTQKQEWISNGHGRYSELPDQEAFFAAVKKSPRLAIHFYRPTTARCQIVDARLEKLAGKHVETKFCRIDAEKCPYLVDKLTIQVMPTILLVKDTQTVHQIRGFDEMGGSDDFHEDTLAWVMAQYGCCTYEGDPPQDPTKGSGGVNRISLMMGAKSVREGGANTADDSDSDDYN